MRVLIDYRPALTERSGAGEYTHELVRALLAAYPPDRNDHRLEVTLFSSSWKDRLRLGPELSGAQAIDRAVPVRLLNLAWHRLGWPAAETLAGADYDVTHSSHPLLMPSRVAAQVVTIHDLNFLSHPEQTRAEIRRDYPDLVHRHAARADRILVPSQFTALEVERRLGVPADRISICPPGAPDWTTSRGGRTDGYLLFVGTLEPRKNIGALLDAYEQLVTTRPAPDLVLAGRRTEASEPWLARIGRAPLAGHVRYVGYVEQAERRTLFDGARLFVQPSFEEGFGMAALEAMTLGIPIVAANRGAQPEVIGDAGTLVDPDRPEQLAAAIGRMLDDEALASAAGSRGALRSKQFRWEATARRVYDAYAQAIEHRQQCASA